MPNVRSKVLLAGLAALLSVGVSCAHAQTRWMGGRMDPGWFAGASVGPSKTGIDASDVTLPTGIAFDTFTADEKDVGYKVFLGYSFHPNVAVELGYSNLGKFSFEGATAAGTVSGSVKNRGGYVDLVGNLPLGYGLSALARVGAYYNETKADFGATGGLVPTVSNANERKTNLKYGLGLQYDVTRNIGVRAEWEHFRKLGDENTTGEFNVNLYSIGGVFRFQ